MEFIRKSKSMKIRTGFCRMMVSLCFAFTCMTYVGSAKDITVSAAISLKNAFEEIGTLYQAHYGTKVIFNFGGSGDLMKQIAGGAPVDVFVSAAQKDMDELEKLGLIDSLTRSNIASNSIVLIVPAGGKTVPRFFEDLNSPDIKRIAVGNPKTVPAGRYAEEVFITYKLLPSIKEKCIYTENVRQALDYVARGEVDAGVVYATDAAARPKETVVIAAAPESSHKPVVYPIAVVSGSQNRPEAKAFISLVLSEEGRKILQMHGFRTNR
jgi:molybdate transport system substrate-binding protein